MGAVDSIDLLKGRYKKHLKSRKWYIRLFSHLIDMTFVNQVEFRSEVAFQLFQLDSFRTKNARPSNLESEIVEKEKED